MNNDNDKGTSNSERSEMTVLQLDVRVVFLELQTGEQVGSEVLRTSPVRKNV
jgi:hypothetical protein